MFEWRSAAVPWPTPVASFAMSISTPSPVFLMSMSVSRGVPSVLPISRSASSTSSVRWTVFSISTLLNKQITTNEYQGKVSIHRAWLRLYWIENSLKQNYIKGISSLDKNSYRVHVPSFWIWIDWIEISSWSLIFVYGVTLTSIVNDFFWTGSLWIFFCFCCLLHQFPSSLPLLCLPPCHLCHLPCPAMERLT